MGFTYDKEKHDELVADRTKLQEQLLEVSTKSNDIYATDENWDAGRLAKYNAEMARHAQLERQIDRLDGKIEKYELLQPDLVKKAQKTALSRFLKAGENGLEKSEIDSYIANSDDLLGERVFRITREIEDAEMTSDGEIRLAPTRSDNASGQEATQPTVERTLVDRLNAYGGVSRVAMRFNTEDGTSYKRPQIDTASQMGLILSEQAQDVGQEDLPPIGNVEFLAYTATSRGIDLTREMIQDNIVNIEGYISMAAVRRMGRAWEFAYTHGDNSKAAAGGRTAGTNSINGIVNSAGAGITAAAQTAVEWDEFVDFEVEVDAAYLELMEMGEGGFNAESGGMIGFLMSRKFEALCKKLKDTQNRPLWLPSVRDGEPNSILGWPYEIGFALDEPKASSVPCLFGNFAYYGIRQVAAVDIFRFFDSGTANTNKVRYTAFSRRDARPRGAEVGGKCEAFKKLTMKA